MSKTAVIILDGWGLAASGPGNAIDLAHTPFMDHLMRTYPHTTLLTSGEDVGLPEGQMGNSEVGHLNIGAGRVVWQDLANINRSIREKTIDTNTVLLNAINTAKERNCNFHLIGLVSDGGVHSHINHLRKLCSMAYDHSLKKVYVHAFTDGRDTDPKGGINYLRELENHMRSTTGKIASITGRYYAMDRDKRWERIKIAYDALVHGIGTKSSSWETLVMESYEKGVTDEFILPIIIPDESGNPLAVISENDVVVCFNFRTDRCREITVALTQQDFPQYEMKAIRPYYVTMTRYDDTFADVQCVFEKDNLSNTLGEVIARHGKSQLRIAETEKYPHVTFFFSGGREEPFTGESRIMVPSPKVATYDMQPEMSAPEVKDQLLNAMRLNAPDFICLNFANADMVGHTGIVSAAITAVETVDACLKEIVESGLQYGYTFLIFADHGNADVMINADGSPNTAHTTNPVPCVMVGSDEIQYALHPGRLADIAPTVLKLMNIPVPAEMSGRVLITAEHYTQQEKVK